MFTLRLLDLYCMMSSITPRRPFYTAGGSPSTSSLPTSVPRTNPDARALGLLPLHTHTRTHALTRRFLHPAVLRGYLPPDIALSFGLLFLTTKIVTIITYPRFNVVHCGRGLRARQSLLPNNGHFVTPMLSHTVRDTSPQTSNLVPVGSA